MRKLIIFICLILLPVIALADRDGKEQVILHHTGNGGHIEHYAPVDMPEVYYDSDESEIIIVADGFSSYYDVLIIRNSTNQTMVSMQIIGYGDSIDISSLPSDNYILVITSEYNNVFQGSFSIL